MKAYVLLNVELGHEDEVRNTVKQIPNTSIVKTFGAFDFVVTIYDESPETMKDTITWQIRKIPHVKSTMTLISVDHAMKVEAS